MSDKQPEALRLADALDGWGDQGDLLEASAKLRNQHELIVEMREALKNFTDGCSTVVDAFAVARAAIAKAEAQS